MEVNDELVARRWMVREEELDDEQYEIKSLRTDNYLINGCAGSGKTILALQKAKEIQDLNLGTYLVIIFTHTLKNFIKDGITSLGLDPDRVCNYHSLDKNGFVSADYIIVDEIQDFKREQIDKLKNMARKNFVFFGDDAQQIYGLKNNNINLNEIQVFADIASNNHKKLDKNYRLPKSIADFAQKLHSNAGNLAGRCTKLTGDKPLVLKCINTSEQLDYIVNLVRNETLQDVGILVGTNKDIELLKDYFENIEFDAEYKYYEERENNKKLVSNLDFYTSKPKVMTYHSSKGLQFEHVFMPLCEYDYVNNNFREAMYVAITRTSQRLIVLYSGILSPFIQSIDSVLYEHDIK
ncbi:ATP-binding domain-containing protein [Bacillus altitudinis]|uniref:ATP-binding domain-containing protein n=1 Tax=Bacillus altitudinis TaxID=293387 RepID=UPI001375D62D|nr:ATP-binding domain-containing protein [Bacillus altitudinis]